MSDPRASALNARLFNLVQTGFDSDTGTQATVFGQKNPGGREYAHALYPQEFEAYAIALELVNGDDYTEEFFSFPIMPKSISNPRPTNTSIEKTMSGVVITSNPSFVPFDIHLNGTFGRKFKRIETRIPDRQPTKGNGTGQVNQNSVTSIPIFDSDYKTGYGCYKIMERIILKAQKQDQNQKPYKLFLYNLSLDYNFMVEPIVLVASQNRDSSNMMWEYNLHLKAVAPASGTNKNYKSSLKLLTDFPRLTQETVFQADEIEQYKKDREQIDKQKSKVQKILERQAQGRAYGLFNNSQKSAIQALLELTDDPTDLGDFSINSGEGILNRF